MKFFHRVIPAGKMQFVAQGRKFQKYIDCLREEKKIKSM